jgi:amidase/aspartyl-tRNA(Asn)/glutamyl-tRNA(Gln) amidotransferase subunit A
VGDLASTTATELAGRIRRRELSPVEVMDATIARIEARNPSLNALVFTAFDEARAAAREAERAVTSGAELGPLHGVPAAIKDLSTSSPAGPRRSAGSRPSATTPSTRAARSPSGRRPPARSSSARATAR